MWNGYHQKRKFLGHVSSQELLLNHVGRAISKREDHIDDIPYTGQGRGTDINRGQRKITTVSIGYGRIYRWITHREIVQCAVLVCRARVIGDLHNSVEHFACGLGESEEAVRAQGLNPETQALIDTFRRLSRRSYASGLGALYAYESQFPAVASAKIEGLIERYGISDEQTLRFFRVHESADVEHSAVCRALLDRLPDDEKAEAVAAGEELAGALWNFLSGVEARASVH